jgi:hypothetical protein
VDLFSYLRSKRRSLFRLGFPKIPYSGSGPRRAISVFAGPISQRESEDIPVSAIRAAGACRRQSFRARREGEFSF